MPGDSGTTERWRPAVVGAGASTARWRQAAPGADRMPRASVPVDEWRVSIALFVALALACSSLNVLLAGVAWWFQMALVCALVVGAAAATRRLDRRFSQRVNPQSAWRPNPQSSRRAAGQSTRQRLLPSAVAAAVLLVSVIVAFSADTTLLLVIPTGDTWSRFVELANTGAVSISRQAVPAIADTGITFFLVIGVGAIAIVADFLAVSLRSPALAGLPLLLLVAVPGMTDFDLSDGFAFMLAAAGYLWLLVAGRPRSHSRLALVVGAVALVGAVVVPSVLPPVVASGDGSAGGGLSTGVNPVLNLGQDLRRVSETNALSYSTTSGDSHYLRLVSLENFTGKAWAPDDIENDPNNTVNEFAPPPGLSPEVATEQETIDIQVGALSSPWLPLPYPTSRISGLNGNWFWEPSGLSVSSPDHLASGQDYQVSSLILKPTPAQLTAAGTIVPSGFTKYLDLPSDLPAIITNTATAVVAGESTNYEKAVALQEFFRNGDFDYSETAPVDQNFDGSGMAVIAKFLQVKSGYCIHFASAMAVMARTLGIPARVAVGFLPGKRVTTNPRGDTQYRVTSHDLHAWPELYFENIGWVPFEPTTGRGVLPSYADQSVPGVPVPISQSPGAAAATATAAPSAAAKPDDGGQSGSASTSASSRSIAGWLWAGGIVLAVILIVLTPATVRRIRRERRFRALRRGGPAAVLAWQEVRDTAEDVGLRLPSTGTPHEEARVLALATGDTATDGAIGRLRSAVERESYARSTSPSPASVDDVQEVSERLRSTVAGFRRVGVALLPLSILNRVFRPSR